MPGYSQTSYVHPVLLRGTVPIPIAKGVVQGDPVQSALATAASGGSIANGNYFVKVTAVTFLGEGLPSNEQTITTTGTGISTITVTWSAVTGATSYKVYIGTTTNGENLVSTVTGAVTTTLTALPGTSGTPPTTGAGGPGDTLIYGFHILSAGTAATVTLTGFIDSDGAAASIVWTGSTSVDTIVQFPSPILNEYAALVATASVDAKVWIYIGPYNAAGTG